MITLGEPPRPTTIHSVLWSAGVPRPTWHVYVETKAAEIRSPRPEVWLFIYECMETGERRPWGNTSRAPDPSARYG